MPTARSSSSRRRHKQVLCHSQLQAPSGAESWRVAKARPQHLRHRPLLLLTSPPRSLKRSYCKAQALREQANCSSSRGRNHLVCPWVAWQLHRYRNRPQPIRTPWPKSGRKACWTEMQGRRMRAVRSLRGSWTGSWSACKRSWASHLGGQGLLWTACCRCVGLEDGLALIFCEWYPTRRLLSVSHHCAPTDTLFSTHLLLSVRVLQMGGSLDSTAAGGGGVGGVRDSLASLSSSASVPSILGDLALQRTLALTLPHLLQHNQRMQEQQQQARAAAHGATAGTCVGTGLTAGAGLAAVAAPAAGGSSATATGSSSSSAQPGGAMAPATAVAPPSDPTATPAAAAGAGGASGAGVADLLSSLSGMSTPAGLSTLSTPGFVRLLDEDVLLFGGDGDVDDTLSSVSSVSLSSLASSIREMLTRGGSCWYSWLPLFMQTRLLFLHQHSNS